ncbi:MAG: glycosyltransferase [Chloroflexi bacterium]|nr:glycosyltransferase [Chloroflexota bacterium]
MISYEQEDNWSLANLLKEQPDAVEEFRDHFPDLRYEAYPAGPSGPLRLRAALADADVAIVHEWNEPEIIHLLGHLARELGIRAVFHDTHYRVVLDDGYRARLGLENYHDMLAFSPSVAERYHALGFRNVHVVHEAADTTVFKPLERPMQHDVVFIGNYGDGDRNDELERFVFGPRMQLPHLRYAMYGVRYPDAVLVRMRNGLAVEFGGGVRNVQVPEVYAASKVALHVPRRQYVELLPGTPTIRMFEALATGTCLVSLPWPDTDALFTAGTGGDYLVVRTSAEMRDALEWLTADDAARERIGRQGLSTILARHTCDHRADQLLALLGSGSR